MKKLIIIALLAATPASAQTFDPKEVGDFLASLSAPVTVDTDKRRRLAEAEKIVRDERRKQASDLFRAEMRVAWLKVVERDIADDKLCSEWAASKHIIDGGVNYRRCRDRLDAAWSKR